MKQLFELLKNKSQSKVILSSSLYKSNLILQLARVFTMVFVLLITILSFKFNSPFLKEILIVESIFGGLLLLKILEEKKN